MSNHLRIEWKGAGAELLAPEVRLFPFDQRVPGTPMQAEKRDEAFEFGELEPQAYLLSLRYQSEGKHYDSCYFQLDSPDITEIQLTLDEVGARIDHLGFVNEQGELVDMLDYTDGKPYLTRAVEDYPFLQVLAEFLVFRFSGLAPAEGRAQLNQLLGDLAKVYPELVLLWPYQLKRLIQPAYLAQTTPEWKACLLTLLRNNLILSDDESLYEQLQQAIEHVQQQDAVAKLAEDGDWDSDETPESFLRAIAGKKMLS